MGPGCVKTCASRGSAKLFSPFASFEDCSPRSLSLNQLNRDENFCAQVRRRSFHTAWVRLGHRGLAAGCPFYPQDRTSSAGPALSVSCQERKVRRFIDHFVERILPALGCTRRQSFLWLRPELCGAGFAFSRAGDLHLFYGLRRGRSQIHVRGT
jgi:hypothetical protein